MYGNSYGEYVYWCLGVKGLFTSDKKITKTKKQIKVEAIYFYLQIFTLLPLVPWSFEHQLLCREWTIVQTKFNCVNPCTGPKQAWMVRNLDGIYFSVTTNRLVSFL